MSVDGPKVRVYFAGERRCEWDTNGASFRRRFADDPNWLTAFAGVTLYRTIDLWLIPALGLTHPPDAVFGVELRLLGASGVELCTARVSEDGSYALRPTSDILISDIAKNAELLITSGVIRCVLNLSPIEDGSWGTELRKILLENATWREQKFRLAAEAFSTKRVGLWIANKRASGDPDTVALALALVENVHEFVKKWPADSCKKNMEPWKKFVTEALEGDIDALLLFCPRRSQLKGTTVISKALDAFAPVPKVHVERILSSMTEMCRELGRPLFAAKMLFAAVGVTRFACTSETVLKVRSGQDEEPSHFYMDSTSRRTVDAFAQKNAYVVAKRPPHRVQLAGVVVNVESWIVDHHVVLQFIEGSVFEKFDHTLEVAGLSYKCQRDGIVATHAIARIMKLIQDGHATHAETLARTVRQFHDKTALGFPVIGGQSRKKKKIYFSDYNKPFLYRSDGTTTVPDETLPLTYTKHMHENNVVNIWS